MSETLTRTKPPQAGPLEPHWIVVVVSPTDGPTETATRKWRRLFRHPTELSAERECARLAAANPGARFQVYASGASCKVEVKPETENGETAA